MICLSLWQPWATLLVAGKKRVETRGWPIRHRGPLLIHAAKRWEPDQCEVAANWFFRRAIESLGYRMTSDLAAIQSAWGLPLGAILGSVDVVDCYPTREVRAGLSAEPSLAAGPGWRALDIGMQEMAFGDYSPGRFAFLCANPVQFETPVPYRGRQSLFEVDEWECETVLSAVEG